jgi:hypothetical protein
MKRLILPLVILSSLFVLAGASYLEGGLAQREGKETIPPAQLEKPHPKLTSAIDSIIKTYKKEGLTPALTSAEKQGLATTYDLVQVVIEGKNEFVSAAIKGKVEDFGGMVEAKWENLVQARVPIYEIVRLAELSEVKLVREPYRPIPMQVVGEGVGVIGAAEWANVSFHPPAQPVKVAIFDGGFKDYENLLGTELPSSVTVKSFRYDGDIEANSVHGTACAEVIYDIAPDAQFYLVNFGSDVEHHQAVDYFVQQEIDVVSYSMGWANMGAGNGTGPICEDVDEAHQNGILWVSAAGNDAEHHWEGTFSDPNSNGWHNFIGTDETLSVYLYAGYTAAIFLNWDDWYNSDQDYDIYLTTTGGFIVAGSTNWQAGTQWPTEAIYYTPSTTGWYNIWINKYSATRNVKLEIFVWGAGALEHIVKSGSLCVPADSGNAVTVGATFWGDDSLEAFSSQGPTSDGRVKPDLAAPDGVNSVTYAGAFYGTSASTPHVAGACALIKSKIGIFNWDNIYDILSARAIDYGPTGKDNKYGYGRLSLKKK